jgi:hypothetical protein
LPRKLLLPLAALISFTSVIGASAWLTGSPPPEIAKPLRPVACDDPVGMGVERAGSIAAIFVDSTVVSVYGKRNAECSFDLVTEQMRGGRSRAQWKQRNPVAPFPIDYRESVESGLAEDVVVLDKKGKPCEQAEGCRPFEVSALLYVGGPRDRVTVSEIFQIRLVLTPKGWRVAFWGSVDGAGVGQPRVAMPE